MSKGLRISLIVTGIVIAAAALLLLGIQLGRAAFYAGDLWPGSAQQHMAPRYGYHRGPVEGFAGMGPGMGDEYRVSHMDRMGGRYRIGFDHAGDLADMPCLEAVEGESWHPGWWRAPAEVPETD